MKVRILFGSDSTLNGSFVWRRWTIQYFIKNKSGNSFIDGVLPELQYVVRINTGSDKMPRAMHAHEDLAEIVYISEGSGIHIIDNKKYETKAGDILVFNCNVLHDERPNPDGFMRTYCIGMSGLHLKGLPPNCVSADNAVPVIHSNASRKSVESLYELLYNEVFSTIGNPSETCCHLMVSLLLLVGRLAAQEANDQDDSTNIIVEQIRTYLDQHYLSEFTLEQIARSLNISPYYLVHVFKEQTGSSPMQYVINRRIGEAQSLLISSDLPVTRIAAIVGYDNANYFNMLFRKKVGVTPGSYRNQYTASEQGTDSDSIF